jgi:hypothetical protein
VGAADFSVMSTGCVVGLMSGVELVSSVVFCGSIKTVCTNNKGNNDIERVS